MSGRGRAASAVALLVSLAAAVTACTATSSEGDELTVFAAASLRDVLADLEVAWLDEHPESQLTVATEASNVVAAQIAEGAPADVFISADTERPQQLADDGLTAAQPRPFARNRVTVVVPLGSERVQMAADLATPGVRLVATGPGVPITRYADEALAQLAATMPDPQAFALAVEANVVSREDNVRATLAKVELGEGDAAVAYRTDALASERVTAIPFPAPVDVTAEYAMVQISERDLAAGFVAWLGGPAASEVIEAAGFEPPGP